MFGNSRLDSEALDRHITGNYGEDFLKEEDDPEEYDPPCKECGEEASEHPTVHRTDPDGNDYDIVVCPWMVADQEGA